ncbi:radical SAM protein [Adlercreutzia sp. R25]|uniref:Radical SAM protein n=1 Tax=Adlercreutzia shanghongiae TaxID=3111773 RepID=A0ABU6IXX3_9ACTN|nr:MULTISPECIES: radical SAM protein [unclassified Adlercreutzia]MEC4271616.1 radical SAM protein [Adlercreutzia sp. R25]MEC4294623.1 radical SAM protein [Adlercreutzia sp. R22]
MGERGLLFSADGVSMFGSLSTGHLIGLSPEEVEWCEAFAQERISLREVAAKHPDLADELERGELGEVEPSTVCGAYLHVTQRCNLSCIGCYSGGGGRNLIPDPPLEKLEFVLSYLARLGVSTLNISGGEPFLRSDLPEIVKKATESYGIEVVNVLTNGTVCDTTMLQRLAPFVAAISVSFDGVSASDAAPIRGRQRFDELIEFVGLAQEIVGKVCITPTLHRKNIEDMPRYQALANSLGVDLGFSLLSTPSAGCSTADLLPESPDLVRMVELLLAPTVGESSAFSIQSLAGGLVCRNCCGAGKSTVSVDADGSVYPCHMMHDARFLMGNVFKETAPAYLEDTCWEVWSLAAECEECDYRYLCGGGCRARTVAAGSDKDPYCAMHQAFYGEVLRRVKRQFERRECDAISQ